MKTVLSLLVFSAICSAQAFEAGAFGGIMRLGNGGDIGSLSVTDTSDPAARVKLQDRWLIGARMTLNAWNHFGYEMAYAHQKTSFQIGPTGTGAIGTTIHTVTVGMLAYATPEGSRVRPFLQGGGGFNNFIFPGGSLYSSGNSNKLGFFYGGGIKVRLKEDSPWMMRFDFRQFQSGKPYNLPGQDGLLKRNEISVGVSYVL